MTIFSQQSYLEKHRFAERQVFEPPKTDLAMVVVIPCFNEPDLLTTLNSLENCEDPKERVEVLIVLNSGIHTEEFILQRNRETAKAFFDWQAASHKKFRYYLLNFPALPKKHAGVGLARKIGMDEAVDRFEQAGHSSGIIVCLDADSKVDRNYLTEISKHFIRYPRAAACSIYFEHPVTGNNYPTEVYMGIIWYELYLRYYIEALRYAGHPFAYHTIGSAMAVRREAYERQGGMNRRKAGEDFYFLQKFIENGKLNELNTTRVIPSPRPAENVPFGTGKSITEWLKKESGTFDSYNLRIFQELKAFWGIIPSLYTQSLPELPPAIHSFLDQQNIDRILPDIRSHVSGQAAFVKRFYRWMNGLKILQYVHYARDHFYPNLPLLSSVEQLIRLTGEETDPLPESPLEWLWHYRRRQQSA